MRALVIDILIQAEESEAINELHLELARNGFACSFTAPGNGIGQQITEQFPDLLIVETYSHSATNEIRELTEKIKRKRPLPILVLANDDILESNDNFFEADDFITRPFNVKELAVRIKRLLHKTHNANRNSLIEVGDLIIDQNTCEVTVSGQLVMLTFKEYELLKFLANNKDRVFSRAALLKQVWGYDYFGGDRTVDVHIRRLRSKIEHFDNQHIETVRNIGYRLRAE
jgi:two-component system alkaline phosphatase synthesis response regulator PhoP